MKNKIVSLSLIFVLAVFMSGCSTTTVFQTNIPGAKISINGEPIGETPCTLALSNAVWETYCIKVEKTGYKDIILPDIRREAKVVPLCTFMFLVPLLWCYGPVNYQNYVLTISEASR